jgi:hypothetical protein
MNLSQLRYFLTIADEGSFTHADRARRNARSALGLQAGELEVAAVPSVACGLLPPAFERWRERYLATTITLREYAYRRALDDAVRTGVGDIAVGPRSPQWDGPVVELGREEFVAILPSTDPLSTRKRAIRLEALAERDWRRPNRRTDRRRHENRGVPGSSPGLAIQNRLQTSDLPIRGTRLGSGAPASAPTETRRPLFIGVSDRVRDKTDTIPVVVSRFESGPKRRSSGSPGRGSLALDPPEQEHPARQRQRPRVVLGERLTPELGDARLRAREEERAAGARDDRWRARVARKAVVAPAPRCAARVRRKQQRSTTVRHDASEAWRGLGAS